MKPILFNTGMVKAILEGRKSVTRRIIKQAQYAHWWEYNDDGSVEFMCGTSSQNGDSVSFGDWAVTVKPPYKVGDEVYVRETWNNDWCDHVIYKADGGSAVAAGYAQEPKWRPSIHMPVAAARIFLRVTDVWPERLQDMETSDVHNEGIKDDVCAQCLEEYGSCQPRQDIDVTCGNEEQLLEQFADIWDSTIKKAELPIYGWDANPWVWVIEFERIDKPKLVE